MCRSCLGRSDDKAISVNFFNCIFCSALCKDVADVQVDSIGHHRYTIHWPCKRIHLHTVLLSKIVQRTTVQVDTSVNLRPYHGPRVDVNIRFPISLAISGILTCLLIILNIEIFVRRELIRATVL